jgi:cellobiose phosphorylase
VWALAAAAKAKDADLLTILLAALDPTSKDPERYQAEPYVLPGNVDGPASPWHGRAGWTWYTGSAAWLPQVLSEWVLGVRPTWEGLVFDPCLPCGWPRARMTRPWRGALLEVEIERCSGPGTPVEVSVDGRLRPDNLMPEVTPGARHRVEVRFR